MKLILTAVVCLCLAAQVLPTAASPETDLLFATRHFSGASEDASLIYRRDRMIKPWQGKEAVNSGERIDLTLGVGEDGKRYVDIVVDPEGRAQRYDRFVNVPGNPMLMVFLEGITRTLAEWTGGSPHYIRNRIRAALANDIVQRSDDLGRILLQVRPFDAEPDKRRLGPFEGLELSFTVDRESIGMLVSMAARAGDGYREEIRLESVR